jgi:hypothetical protein
MQIAAFQGKRERPLLTTLDRVFWVTPRSLWSDWRHRLIHVQADTVVRWHRKRFRSFCLLIPATPESRTHLSLNRQYAFPERC